MCPYIGNSQCHSFQLRQSLIGRIQLPQNLNCLQFNGQRQHRYLVHVQLFFFIFQDDRIHHIGVPFDHRSDSTRITVALSAMFSQDESPYYTYKSKIHYFPDIYRSVRPNKTIPAFRAGSVIRPNALSSQLSIRPLTAIQTYISSATAHGLPTTPSAIAPLPPTTSTHLLSRAQATCSTKDSEQICTPVEKTPL